MSDVQEKKEEAKLKLNFIMFEWNAEVPVAVDCFCVIRLLVFVIFFLYFSVFAFPAPQWACVNYIKCLGENGSHELNLKAIYSFTQIIYYIKTYWSFAIPFLVGLKFQIGDSLIMERIIIWIVLCLLPISQFYLGRKFFSMLRIWTDIRYIVIYGERHY